MDELVDLIRYYHHASRKDYRKLPAQKDIGKVKKILAYHENEAGGHDHGPAQPHRCQKWLRKLSDSHTCLCGG